MIRDEEEGIGWSDVGVFKQLTKLTYDLEADEKVGEDDQIRGDSNN